MATNTSKYAESAMTNTAQRVGVMVRILHSIAAFIRKNGTASAPKKTLFLAVFEVALQPSRCDVVDEVFGARCSMDYGHFGDVHRCEDDKNIVLSWRVPNSERNLTEHDEHHQYMSGFYGGGAWYG